jgi:hypothetical protein
MSDVSKMDKFQVAELVKGWLSEEGLTAQDFPDASADVAFAFSQGNSKINVGFHKTSVDSLMIIGGIILEPQEQTMLKYTKTKVEFLLDVQIAFLQQNLDFIIEPTNNRANEFSISDIKLQKTIYFDGLTKDRFFDIVSAIYNCLKILDLKFKLLGRPKPI